MYKLLIFLHLNFGLLLTVSATIFNRQSSNSNIGAGARRIRFIYTPDNDSRTVDADAHVDKPFIIGVPSEGAVLFFRLYKSVGSGQDRKLELAAELGRYPNVAVGRLSGNETEELKIPWKLNDYNLTESGENEYLIEGEALDEKHRAYKPRIATKSRTFEVVNIKEKKKGTSDPGSESSSSSTGLSQSTKKGLAIGISLGAAAILCITVVCIVRGRRRGQRNRIQSGYSEGEFPVDHRYDSDQESETSIRSRENIATRSSQKFTGSWNMSKLSQTRNSDIESLPVARNPHLEHSSTVLLSVAETSPKPDDSDAIFELQNTMGPRHETRRQNYGYMEVQTAPVEPREMYGDSYQFYNTRIASIGADSVEMID